MIINENTMMHRQVALYPPDVDKRQIQRYHQRRPAQMRLQEQHQECRTDYRRALPGGIQVAGDRPGVRSAAKGNRGDPVGYAFPCLISDIFPDLPDKPLPEAVVSPFSHALDTEELFSRDRFVRSQQRQHIIMEDTVGRHIVPGRDLDPELAEPGKQLHIRQNVPVRIGQDMESVFLYCTDGMADDMHLGLLPFPCRFHTPYWNHLGNHLRRGSLRRKMTLHHIGGRVNERSSRPKSLFFHTR